MASGTVKIHGLREVERALRDLPKATGKAAMRRVLKAGGEPIAQAARQRAPVDVGNLRESIDVSTRLSRSQRSGPVMTAAGWRNASKSGVVMYVGPGTQPQAITQEFGTFKEPPQPFMRPAWDAERENALGIIRDSLWAEIEKAAARHARKLARMASKG